MSEMKLHIIFPKDSSTDFLQEIVHYLEDNSTTVPIKVHRLKTSEEHSYVIDNAQTEFAQNSTILFLGHGMSSAISGASTQDYIHPRALIQESELAIFQERNLVLLSCRSDEYIRKYAWEAKLKCAIGFPNLVTDEYDRYGSEEDWVKKVSIDDIDLYRGVIVDVLKYSLEDYIENGLSLFQLYKRIRLRAQRKFMLYCKSLPKGDKPPYWHMLFDLSQGVIITGN